MNNFNDINTIGNIYLNMHIFIRNLGMTNPILLAILGFLCGGIAAAFCIYQYHKYYYRGEFTTTFASIKRKQRGPVAGQIDHILKPTLILKNKENADIFVKKLRNHAIAFTASQWNLYEDNRREFYEREGFKKVDVDECETLNYHLIDFNTKFLTRRLFKKSEIQLPIDDYYNSPQITPLELEYEKLLKKLIEHKLLAKPK
jgi:hypothetical protein